MRLFVIAIIFFLSHLHLNVLAGEGNEKYGNWMMYFGQIRLNKHWSIHNEVQWRNHEILPNLEQMLLRGGVNYHFSRRFIVTAGYGYISTHPFDKELTRTLSNEHRIWQQALYQNRWGRLSMEHRARYEQRWVNRRFMQRGRYRLMLTVPLNKPMVEAGSVVVAVYNELFMNVQQNNIFDRNRLYKAIGYQFSPTLNIQVGSLYQSLPDSGKHYFQLALFFNPNFTDKMMKLPIGS